MRINTHCFNGFVKLLSDSYDITLTEDDYYLSPNGYIDYWRSSQVEELSAVYCQAWDDAVGSVNHF